MTLIEVNYSELRTETGVVLIRLNDLRPEHRQTHDHRRAAHEHADAKANSCSGCSSAAQMANQLALRLDRDGLAEMSCIAGVGGGVPGLVKTARSGRPILAIDGCPMACVVACLTNAGVCANRHVLLSGFGVKKSGHANADAEQCEVIYSEHVRPAALDLCSIRTTQGNAD